MCDKQPSKEKMKMTILIDKINHVSLQDAVPARTVIIIAGSTNEAQAANSCLLSLSSIFKAANSFGHDSGMPPGNSNSSSFPLLR